MNLVEYHYNNSCRYFRSRTTRIKEFAPYYGFGLLSTFTHELGHAAAANILGVKVTTIVVTPWLTGYCKIKGGRPTSIRTSAIISAAGPLMGLATVTLCLTSYRKQNHEIHTSEFSNDIANVFSGFLVAKELINLIPRKGYDGYKCWWYMKTRVYKGVDHNLLNPRCGLLKTVLLGQAISSISIYFFDRMYPNPEAD